MLLTMSLSGAAIAAAVLVLRAAARNGVPRKVHVLLWDLMILRLLVPFTLPALSGASAGIPGLEQLQKAAASVEAAPDGSLIKTWALLIWIAGAAVCAAFSASGVMREMRRLGAALPASKEDMTRIRRLIPGQQRVRICVSDTLSTAVTAGFFRTRIILPKLFRNWDDKTLKCVLTHELVHAVRRDNLHKGLARAAACVHWFNPFVWAMVFFLERDLEAACDEAAVKILGEDMRRTYAHTLVNLAEEQSTLCVAAAAFGQKAVTERVTRIVQKRSWTAPGAVLTAAAVLCAFGAAAAVFPVDAEPMPWVTVPESPQSAQYASETMFSITTEDGEIRDDSGKVIGHAAGSSPAMITLDEPGGERLRLTVSSVEDEDGFRYSVSSVTEGDSAE